LRAFDRELDELEEWIVCFALTFLVSSIILLAFGRFLGLLAVLPATAQGLSLIAGAIAVLLWLVRRVGSPLYSRLRGPEKNRIQTVMSEKAPSADQ
jgi:hypothetical protein